MQKIKIIELFSGIGAQVAAFKRLQIPYEVVGISEIDKYAIKSYEAINGPTHNYGDITKIPFLDYADLWTYSSPCQDFSTAGKQQGIYNADGSLTRSGLLKHVERLLETSVALGNQPKYLLMENVKGLVSKKFKPDFLKWLDKLEQLGYNNYWQVLNAKDYGIPQNRERVFVVSIRKDVDTNGYTFPAPVPLEKRLKDMLEPVVDEKYYLNDEKVKKFIENFREPETNYCIDANYWKGTTVNDYLKKHRRQLIKEPLACASRGRNPENPSDRTAGIVTEHNNTGCSNTLTSVQKDNYVVEPFIADDTQGFDGIRRYDNYSPTLRSERSGLKVVEPQVLHIGNINGKCSHGGFADDIFNPKGVSPTLNTMQGGNRQPYIVEPNISHHPFSKNMSLTDFKQMFPPCLIATDYKAPKCTMTNDYRIRKLTPKECWRLMGFTDDEFHKAQNAGISNTQLYKQAGNSIVVNVLTGIFKELFSA